MTEKILQLNTEKNIFWTLVGGLVFCLMLYMYCVNATIHNVVAREDLEAQATQLSFAISNQEFQYISLRNQITLPLAYSLGFSDAPEKVFVSKKSLNHVSYLTHEI